MFETGDGIMYRTEHPRPQFERERWLNLNGKWKFAFDFGTSGEEKGWPQDPSALDMEIEVPFCPESRLSGIGHTDFIPAAWYSRTFTLPDDWPGSRVFLNFGGADYHCRAWVNGKLAGSHYGGGASFSFEITGMLSSGENTLVVCTEDDVRSGAQPLGKQSNRLHSYQCFYTRTTGIWQTVWLEARPQSFIESVRVSPDLDNGRFIFTPVVKGSTAGLKFVVRLDAEGVELAAETIPSEVSPGLEIRVPSPRPWSPEDPFLYDVTFELWNGERLADSVKSYAGLRKFHIEGNRFFLNNKPFYLRFVLDQGFYPDGIWTAPSDAELKADIERSMDAGFNGARLHQKVFEERFHYWADRLGYLTWGEFCDWGMDFGNPQAVHNHQREWREVVQRDINHPSIVAWTPFNETSAGAALHPDAHRRAVLETVGLTRELDPTRPVNDSSGYVHVETDIYTVHNYQPSPEKFRSEFENLTPESTDVWHNNRQDAPYAGQPYVVDEYGGPWWEEESAAGPNWGYGERPRDIEEVYSRIQGLTRVLTEHPHMAGFCYTQLTDVEQEQNGIYTYDRKPKFDNKRLREYFGAPAASESRGD
jgi:beta-galactosidase/beta-glucuronidase